jgi:hypothetical protein
MALDSRRYAVVASLLVRNVYSFPSSREGRHET